jgi:hypothetical protein
MNSLIAEYVSPPERTERDEVERRIVTLKNPVEARWFAESHGGNISILSAARDGGSYNY